MVLNTFTVATAVTPTVVETWLSHYLNRKPLRQKPTAHISYHEGLRLVRRFLEHGSMRTIEEFQAFTAQWVPAPRWVKVEEAAIGAEPLQRAATLIQAQLGPSGIDAVGGRLWWQWRRGDGKLNAPAFKAEWIEMRSDYHARRKSANPLGTRVMLYVHGGAYFFGSVDAHRYQLQRHARKLRARLLAPRYRLAPQFPFPCGLQDCLAAYLYLLDTGHDPATILLAGDSAGGGMVLSILVTLRDQGVPLPAGAILISPWVDLTHSFPSVAADTGLDYIPSHGFQHKPSAAWPPPNADDLLALERGEIDPALYGLSQRQRAKTEDRPKQEIKEEDRQASTDRARGFSVHSNAQAPLSPSSPLYPPTSSTGSPGAAPSARLRSHLSRKFTVELDGAVITIKDQIQQYASNGLLDHPLVSPALQPSLGGLPPLLIQVGGGERLRDEQIYVAHKAATPSAYLPSGALLDQYDPRRAQVKRWTQGTDVQLQVWDDLCHVPHTLSWTRPAKFMYRAVAQFGAWALARAQHAAIDIPDDDAVSVISSSSSSRSSSESDEGATTKEMKGEVVAPTAESAPQIADTPSVGRAGDPLPSFTAHMIRQRVDRHGVIYPLPAASDLAGCTLAAAEIGVPKPGPVRTWITAKSKWDARFAHEKARVQKKRLRELREGKPRKFEGEGDVETERPPPSALAGRRVRPGEDADRGRRKKGWGVMMWSGWGSKHDEETIERERRASSTPATSTSPMPNGDSKPHSRRHSSQRPANSPARSRSRHRAVTDEGQAAVPYSPLASPAAPSSAGPHLTVPSLDGAADSSTGQPTQTSDVVVVVPASDTTSTRPAVVAATPEADTAPAPVAFPFKLAVGPPGSGANASTMTLESVRTGSETSGVEKGEAEAELRQSRDEKRTGKGKPPAERVVAAVEAALNAGASLVG